MNFYETSFAAQCPVNHKLIDYRLLICCRETIVVETIIGKCSEFDIGFHEDFANVLHSEIAGLQILDAFHHGVKITTVRGSP